MHLHWGNDLVFSLQGGDVSRSISLANGGFSEGSRHNAYSKESLDPSKNEKEEGELSPNGDFEEDNFVGYRDGGQSMPNPNCADESAQYQNGGEEICCQDAAGENDADADDEDSENVSEAGEDVSGSESAADECSREEDEEDGEQDELDGKGESEGEAEGISEVHLGGEGASVPQSERFLLTSKPLAKHVASSSSDGGKKHRHIFYGNDTFYVLFRLHQVSIPLDFIISFQVSQRIL